MAKSKRVLKKIPVFKTEHEEREFWAQADSTEYVDWSKARVVRFPPVPKSLEGLFGRSGCTGNSLGIGSGAALPSHSPAPHDEIGTAAPKSPIVSFSTHRR